ncbi:zf-DHHC-domain-containing protein [Trametes versicolor FP-101664 SS1]|uniref:zf-DHHC-domain-containing protein n=1 Tax=Trametes versicolor (strain FP-101664) TaxID=717944 RepID=UPI000462475F|nr:zf-DHHC-domain-containing protein [Trametes versicolor FP-101664 SS1]EIW56472.1 zf-DHHC-domain-containing protein [Trametes versicolor FP-101664 SS1]
MASNGTAKPHPEGMCCGAVEEAREKSAARRAKPQPWIVRKLTVFITIGIMGYAFYVYIGRLCVPMIKRETGALGGRGMGIGFLVVFCILGLMMVWAFEKVVLTAPGYAKDHVRKSPAPLIQNALPTWWGSESEAELAAAEYAASHPQPAQSEPKEEHKRSHSQRVAEVKTNGHGNGSANSRHKASQNGHAPPGDEQAGITDALPPVAAVRAKATVDQGPAARPELAHVSSSHVRSPSQPQPLPGIHGEQIPARYTRKPPSTPIMLPEYRYCHKEGFLKPMRAHHCRACGTCVLKYDHHCPWIGQCVGARNHKFFMIFVWWALWFCAWTFGTLVGLNARASAGRPNFDIDGQQVAIMALSGLFFIFVFALFVAHVDLICAGQSTVETLDARRIREREDRVLKRLHAWSDFRGKRATRRQWDAEWGRVGKEGSPWWLGSARRNWEATMGARVWEWFLPIGKSPDDGLSYTLNPRFDAEGRWRPRREWPKELQ